MPKYALRRKSTGDILRKDQPRAVDQDDDDLEWIEMEYGPVPAMKPVSEGEDPTEQLTFKEEIKDGKLLRTYLVYPFDPRTRTRVKPIELKREYGTKVRR